MPRQRRGDLQAKVVALTGVLPACTCAGVGLRTKLAALAGEGEHASNCPRLVALHEAVEGADEYGCPCGGGDCDDKEGGW